MTNKFLLPSQYKLLDGSNYAEWLTPMISLMESHSVWRHADGKRTKPVVAAGAAAGVPGNQKDIET